MLWYAIDLTFYHHLTVPLANLVPVISRRFCPVIGLILVQRSTHLSLGII